MLQDLNKLYDHIKSNLPIIIIVPSIIGGLIQIFQLFQINPTLVRFFSISQAVSDGLLVLLVLLVSLFIPILTLMIIQKYWINLGSRKFVFEIFLAAFVLISIPFTTFSFDFLLSNNVGLFTLLANVSLPVFQMLLLGFLFKRTIDRPISRAAKTLLKLAVAFIQLVLLLNFVRIFSIIILFVNYPNTKINNFNNIVLEFERFDVENVCSYNIEYFNDKYVFINKTCNDNSSIIIEKFDKLF